jgi:hypothetical protein
MAVLRGPDREVELPDRCLVGRSRSCDLVLSARDVSSEHAVLQWCGTHWELRDLGSRNGTLVGEHRLAAGGRAPLAVGARLQFGRESPPWVLVDAAGPRAMAVALVGGERRVADGGYLVLPGADEPLLAVYQEGDGRWRVEQDGATRTIEDREVVEARGPWRVHLPATLTGTWEAGADLMVTARLRLRFSFSRDEEHVELVAWADARRIDLQARVHHYPLLLLARRRLADQRAGVPAAEQGWLRQDELLAMLRMKEDHLGVYIHRARAQFARAGVADAAALVERRPGTRLLRIGVAALELVPLAAAPPGGGP